VKAVPIDHFFNVNARVLCCSEQAVFELSLIHI